MQLQSIIDSLRYFIVIFVERSGQIKYFCRFGSIHLEELNNIIIIQFLFSFNHNLSQNSLPLTNAALLLQIEWQSVRQGNFFLAQPITSLATNSWTVPSMGMYQHSDAAKWQHIDFLNPFDLFQPEPWMSSGWKKTISPFFIYKSILLSSNFQQVLMPKQALFTLPSSGYSWSQNRPLWLFGKIFKLPFYLLLSYKAAHAATILFAGPKGKYAKS